VNARIGLRSLSGATLAVLIALFGCSENAMVGVGTPNRSPEVWLSSGPVEGTTTGYQVHFYWGGWDPDGEIRYFEFVVVDGYPLGFHRQDTTGIDKWSRTSSFDSTFKVSADDSAGEVHYGNYSYTRYDKTHTFFIRAVDLAGRRSDPVYRSFTAWTLAPYIEITMPTPQSNPNAQVSLGKVSRWEWRGTDPIDSPDNTQDPDSIRYMYHRNVTPSGADSAEFDIVVDLNEHPGRYERYWSPWIYYRAPGDSGRATWLGDDEVLLLTKVYIFAVQAKDEAGAVTAIFTRGHNVRQFLVSATAYPKLTITEPFLGSMQFLGGAKPKTERRELPPGVALHFKWYGDATLYGGAISCYQYGWDVADLSNPSDWGSDCSPYNLGCSAIWYSGVHTLYVRCVDNSGSETIGQVEISIVPFRMDRNLLWVDDFPSGDFQQVDYANPTETEHDNFWLGFCNRTIGFDPSRDVYDVAASGNSSVAPKVSLIGRYKNIIWTYSNDLGTICIDDVIRFTPESKVSASTPAINYLSIFLAKGGHLLTEGNSQKGGGLAAVLPTATDGPRAYPLNVKCEMEGNTDGCESDTSTVNSFAYKDYCVTMLDKIDPAGMRTDSDMPLRRIRNYDCMYPGAVKSLDAWHDSVPGMPSTLDLWSTVIAAGHYYAPNEGGQRPGGFTQVEVYDPHYWMARNSVLSQRCFHPMYLMRAKNSNSALNNQAVALWVTKYADIVPDVISGVAVAAPSAHFGFELWFFDRAQGRTLMNVILQKWQILATP
jgi:hypothetical protein